MTSTLIESYTKNNFFGKLIGMEFKILSGGEVEYYLTITKEHLATPHAAHGGAISSLVDAALGVAGLSLVHTEDKVVSTIEYKINFLSPALLNDRLVARAKVEQKGKMILVISCEVICSNRSDTAIAKALGTFNAYDKSKAGY
jgi:acyl-CoA thioesterase